jgi:opacity protein-like surface antigen
MKILKLTAVLILLFTLSSSAQRGDGYRRMHSEGFYINLGVANGPDFADFFNYINEFYQDRFQNTNEELDRFDKGLDFGLGYIVRFYPNFALDVGFSIYRLESSGRINNQNPSFPESYINHELEYQVAIFSATVPVFLDFDPRQPVVPYAGLGISIYSMRIDDYRDDGVNFPVALRETNTSVGGHFQAGLFIKISKKLWIDFKARWHSGSANLRTAEPLPPEALGKFKIKHDMAQLTLGGVYYFR